MLRIPIPNYNTNNRIVDNFYHLIRIVNATKMAEDIVVWDFSGVSFLHPFLLAPLAIYKNTNVKQIICENVSLSMQSFLNDIFFERALHFDEEAKEIAESVMAKYIENSYIPVCSFSMSEANKEAFGAIVKNIIITQNRSLRNLSTPISYFLSELIDNIYEHSQSKNGYLFSQYIEKEHCIYLCIADTGITIYKSYEVAQKYIQELNNDESEALRFANEGRSTKNRPGAESRGYGISTTRRMLVEGMEGAFYMISGGAFHKYENKKINSYADMHKFFHWDGTMVLLRIPVQVSVNFDYIDYLE